MATRNRTHQQESDPHRNCIDTKIRRKGAVFTNGMASLKRKPSSMRSNVKISIFLQMKSIKWWNGTKEYFKCINFGHVLSEVAETSLSNNASCFWRLWNRVQFCWYAKNALSTITMIMPTATLPVQSSTLTRLFEVEEEKKEPSGNNRQGKYFLSECGVTPHFTD